MAADRPLLDQIARPLGAVLADGAYDGDPVYRAVPNDTAASAPTQRDQHIQMIAERGRLGWQRAVRYGRRSLVEVSMLRYKPLSGRSLRARTLSAQKVEARVGGKVLNIMTSLGMTVSRKAT